MKKLLLAGTAALLGGNALAADLPARMPTKDPPMPVAAAYSWTGCYIGAHAGVGWSRTDFSDPTGFNIAPLGSTIRVDGGPGFVGGGQVGCDYQFASNWVAGLAGDFSWADIDGQTNDPFFSGKFPLFGTAPLPLHSRTDFFGSVASRVGYAWNTSLLYAKGGLAFAHNKYDVDNFGCGFFIACNSSASETKMGWTLGAGYEWAFTPHWSARVEYSHYDFGTSSLTFNDPTNGINTNFNVKTSFDVVTLGINYRFGGPLR